MKTSGLWTSRDRTNISVFGKDEPGEDHAWLITYSDHPPPSDYFKNLGVSVFP